jgi:hypothetical protein
MSTPPKASRQPLNPADLTMLRIHDFLQSLGYAGLVCQTQVWCAGRTDEARLRVALAALCQRFPVMQSRLVRGYRTAEASWVYTGGPGLPLHVHELPDPSEAAVLGCAERLLAQPLDLGQEPPLAFHLLRRPGAGDVLVLQFAHALMDGRAPEVLLSQLERPAPDNGAGQGPANGDDDFSEGYLAGHSRWRRFRSVCYSVCQNWRHRDEPMTIASPDLPRWVLGPPRIALRSVSRADTERLSSRLRRLCGYEAIGAAFLASGFRATAACATRCFGANARCRTFIPFNLRPSGDRQPVFGNLMATVTVSAERAKLADRDGLTRAINAQQRDNLRRGEDLGVMQVMSWLRGRPRVIRQLMLEPGVRERTFGFSFHGRAIAGFDSLCGTAIERLFTVVTDVYPPGLQLQVNHINGRLHLSLFYTAGAIPEPVANAFLDVLVDDVLATNPPDLAALRPSTREVAVGRL